MSPTDRAFHHPLSRDEWEKAWEYHKEAERIMLSRIGYLLVVHSMMIAAYVFFLTRGKLEYWHQMLPVLVLSAFGVGLCRLQWVLTESVGDRLAFLKDRYLRRERVYRSYLDCAPESSSVTARRWIVRGLAVVWLTFFFVALVALVREGRQPSESAMQDAIAIYVGAFQSFYSSRLVWLYVVSVLVGAIVTLAWWWFLKLITVSRPKVKWWMPIAVGMFERTVITTLLLIVPLGAGAFIGSWILVKGLGGWGKMHESEAEPAAQRETFFAGLLGTLMSILWAVVVTVPFMPKMPA